MLPNKNLLTHLYYNPADTRRLKRRCYDVRQHSNDVVLTSGYSTHAEKLINSSILTQFHSPSL